MKSTSVSIFSSEPSAYKRLRSLVEGSPKWLLLCDKNTFNHCSSSFIKNLGLEPDVIFCIGVGESNKNLQQVEKVYEALLQASFDRQSLIVNLGGGVVSDLGGYAATTFKRGIDFINVPTTMLSMVDAAYGGKTGVNFKGIKNQIGAFSSAKAVYTDLSFLKSLLQEELLSGFAEMLKHALIMDEGQWDKLKELTSLNVDSIDEGFVKSSIAIKQGIIALDPFEKGERKKLNFGHTIGHAIESYFETAGSELTHGRAIAAGMICETKLSINNGLDSDKAHEIIDHLINIYGRLELKSTSIPELIRLMQFDKKNTKGALNFTLLDSIGSARINQELTIKEVEKVLFEYIQGR